MGAWSVVIPPTADQTNLVTNPSAETAVTGYTGVTNTPARQATYQRRGAWGVSYAMAAGITDGLYYGTVSLTNGTAYTFSCDVLGALNIPYRIYFGSTAAAVKGTPTTFTGTGDWQRVTVTWTADSSTTFRLYVTKNTSADTSTIYVDGFLCVAASADQLYWDGDSRGFRDDDYYWTGTPHASTSVMRAGTRAGGTAVDLNTYGFYIRAALGLGLAGLTNVITPSPLIGGGSYQRTIPTPHQFALAGTIMGSSLQNLQQLRRSLINAVKPDAAPAQQPVLLRYQAAAGGSSYGDIVEIPALFEGGLEGGELRGFNEEVALKFTSYLPYVAVEDGYEGASLTYQSSIANADYLIVNVNGTWQKLGTAANGAIYSCAIDPITGDIYVSGNFTSIGGVSANYVAKYTISTSAWSALGTGFSVGNYAWDIKFGPNGYPYFAGTFTTANGVTVNRVTYWNGSTFVALGGTAGVGSTAYALAFDASGILYVGGIFTTAGGSAANRVASWNGSAWSALGSGFSAGTVLGLAFGADGRLYAGGDVSLNPATVSVWNGSSWTSIGGATLTAAGFYRAPDNRIYAGAASYLYSYNGSLWTSSLLITNVALNRIVSDKYGNILIATRYGVGAMTLTDYIAGPNGGYLNKYDYYYTTASTGNFGADYRNGTYIAVGDRTGTVTAAALNTLTNNGTQSAYPTFRFTGSGTLYNIRSYTTGDAIYFNLTLQDNEVAYLDLTPGAIRFWSNLRSNLLSTILPGSNLATFRIAPGSNSVSVFMGGTTSGNTSAWVYWRKAHWSLDGGAN